MRRIIPLDLSCDADFTRWQDYITSHPDARYADLGQWRRLFLDLYGIRNVTLACIEDGRTVGVASTYLIASPFFGRMLVTCPFFGYGGLHADDAGARDLLVESVEDAAKEFDVDFVELRLLAPLAKPYRTRAEFLEFEVELRDSSEAVWENTLSSNVRQNVRKSRSRDLRFSVTAEPRQAYGLISTTLRDLGTPFHSRRFFDLLVAHLGDHVRFSEVHLGDRLVAAGTMVRFRDRLSTPYIGSLTRHRATRANYAQYWGIVEHCVEHGIRVFDLGRSPRGSTHQRFKEKWGASPIEVHYSHRLISNRREYRSVTDTSRVERFVSETWKRLPLFVTRRIGHLASRHIP